MVCHHPQQIIDLQWKIPDLQVRLFLPQQCEHTAMEQQIETPKKEWAESRMRPTAAGTNMQLVLHLANMTLHAWQTGAEVSDLRTLLANALTLAARTALAAP